MDHLAIDDATLVCWDGLLHDLQIGLNALRPVRDRLVDWPDQEVGVDHDRALHSMGSILALYIREVESLVEQGRRLKKSPLPYKPPTLAL